MNVEIKSTNSNKQYNLKYGKIQHKRYKLELLVHHAGGSRDGQPRQLLRAQEGGTKKVAKCTNPHNNRNMSTYNIQSCQGHRKP